MADLHKVSVYKQLAKLVLSQPRIGLGQQAKGK
jgi:hypothetical protein